MTAPGAPHPLVRAVHSHGVGYAGTAILTVAVTTVAATGYQMASDPGFLGTLLTPDGRHGMVARLTGSAVMGLFGGVMALLGKGPFAPHLDDTIAPGQ